MLLLHQKPSKGFFREQSDLREIEIILSEPTLSRGFRNSAPKFLVQDITIALLAFLGVLSVMFEIASDCSETPSQSGKQHWDAQISSGTVLTEQSKSFYGGCCSAGRRCARLGGGGLKRDQSCKKSKIAHFSIESFSSSLTAVRLVAPDSGDQRLWIKSLYFLIFPFSEQIFDWNWAVPQFRRKTMKTSKITDRRQIFRRKPTSVCCLW